MEQALSKLTLKGGRELGLADAEEFGQTGHRQLWLGIVLITVGPNLLESGSACGSGAGGGSVVMLKDRQNQAMKLGAENVIGGGCGQVCEKVSAVRKATVYNTSKLQML